MPTPSGIQVVIPSSPDRWEDILRRSVTPLASALRARPTLDAFLFARFNKPSFHLGVSVLGDAAWLEASARPAAARNLAPLVDDGTIAEYTVGEYEPDMETYGGEEGMRLTEQLSHHDSLACLDLMEVEAKGGLERSRREYSLLMVERLLDQLRFDKARRLAFYKRGYKWAIDLGSLNDAELAALEKRYQEVKDGLAALTGKATGLSPEARWGGKEAAAIARRCLEATAPVADQALEALAAGRIRKDSVELAWSWASLHANRLGVLNVAEASLRFFMHRLYEDGKSGAV